ncbi:MAG: hypothetical protein HYZ26_03890 [Chloroflexi bacterium]|nr:hypothetical protein [Chloroflexota bacterium]
MLPHPPAPPRLLLFCLPVLALLAACSPARPGIGVTLPLEGVWRRTEMVVRRTAGPDQPVIQPPFTVVGTLLIIDEEDLALVEQVGDSYSLAGASEDWSCALAGAYSIPISLTFYDDASGEITWRAEDLESLSANMAEPWANTCVYQPGGQGIPTALEDHAPIVAVPTLALQFQLLDGGQTLALTAQFEVSQGEDAEPVAIERAYLYERVK